MKKTVLLLTAVLTSLTACAYEFTGDRRTDNGARDMCFSGARKQGVRQQQASLHGVPFGEAVEAWDDCVKSDSGNRDYTNLVLFVRFADDPEIATPLSIFQSMFTDSAHSVAHFFETFSYGQIHFNTVYAMQNEGNRIVSYVDSHPRGYFKPYSEENPMGYTAPNPLIGISRREAELIARAVRYVDSLGLVGPDQELDGDGNGTVDNLSVIVQGNVEGWAELLWPHMEFFPHDSVPVPATINGKRIDAFNFEFEGSGPTYFSVRTFCHEMCHSIGLPDLYHYNLHTRVIPVPYDIMGGTNVQPSAIYKHKFLHLTGDPVRIVQDGTYTISSNGSHAENNLYYIPSAIDTNQWYTIEYRYTGDPFEQGLPCDGLVIGRWQDTSSCTILWGGNAFYDFAVVPNTYWVFRPGSTIDSIDGNRMKALFSSFFGNTEFGPDTDPHPYLADGTPEGSFRIYGITPNGSTCTFSVQFLNEGIDSDAGETAETPVLFPNPAHGEVALTLPSSWLVGHECQVELFDMLGNKLLSSTVVEGTMRLSTASLPPSVYLLTVATPTSRHTQKLTIK